MEVRQTTAFRKWLERLRDSRARSRIAQRIVRLQAGLIGDVKYFNGIGELRIHEGPGYRVYFVKRGTVLVILLCGGDKGSQEKDIKAAKAIADDLET